jgi:hypothetical protein
MGGCFQKENCMRRFPVSRREPGAGLTANCRLFRYWAPIRAIRNRWAFSRFPTRTVAKGAIRTTVSGLVLKSLHGEKCLHLKPAWDEKRDQDESGQAQQDGYKPTAVEVEVRHCRDELHNGSSADQKDQGVADYPAKYHCFDHVYVHLLVP